MPRNIELKARLPAFSAAEKCLSDLQISRSAVIRQSDIFFKSHRGRLKLRRFPDNTGELIFYQREDLKGPKISSYHIYRTEDAGGLQKTLELAYPVLGEVNKIRDLYLTGHTRIHLDRVDRLGDFLELEVVMEEGQTIEEGAKIAMALMQKLGISMEDCIGEAYIDLLNKKSSAD